MSLHIGDVAPDFSADTSTGEIKFHDWIGKSWVFFFSHPGDFTPVCTTEIGRTAQLANAFAKRHVKPLGLSTDGVAEHLACRAAAGGRVGDDSWVYDLLFRPHGDRQAAAI